MSKRIKILICTFTLILSLFIFAGIGVYASEYDDIQNEVSTLVVNGTLQGFHNNLSRDTGYQTLYTKMYRQGSTGVKNHFTNLSESELRSYIQSYENDWDAVWYDIITNLDVEPKYLDPNRVLGLYYDSYAGNNSSYLYLIWTSKYIPSEFMTINSLELNGTKYNAYQDEACLKPFWFDSKY